jgi:hypothetical protein
MVLPPSRTIQWAGMSSANGVMSLTSEAAVKSILSLQRKLQVALLSVIKRDKLQPPDTNRGQETNRRLYETHRVFLDLNIPVYGLLVVGAYSLRIVATWDKNTNQSKFAYWDENGRPRFLETDCKEINSWLLEQAIAFFPL